MLDFTKEQAIITTATPALIDWMLGLNTRNRPVKRSQVEALRREIRAGRWRLTNQGFGIAASGFLSDCQHRLTAIKEEGCPPLKMLIVTGLSDDAQAVTDTHARRSQSDIIHLLLNQKVSTRVVAAVNMLLRIEHLGGGRFTFSLDRGRTSEFEIAQYIDQHENYITPVMEASGRVRAGATAALIDYARLYDIEAACDLADQVNTGANLAQTDPAYRLIRWLEAHPTTGRDAQQEAYCATVAACIAHARGDSLGRLHPATSWARLPRHFSLVA